MNQKCPDAHFSNHKLKRLNQVEESSTIESLRICQTRKKAGLPVYNAGLGESPMPAPKYIVDTIKQFADKKRYSCARGINQLHQLLGERMVVGNGLKPLLYILQLGFSLMYSDGVIYHISPAWVSYIEQANTLSCRSIVIDTKDDGWKLTPKVLDRHLSATKTKPALLIFNNPTNPTGLIYSKEEVIALAEVMKRYQTIVMCDQIYGGLVYPDFQSIFGQLHNHYSNCITGNSLSKIYGCGGYRFGWLVFPPSADALHKQCLALASSIYTCPTTLLQHATADILQNHGQLSDHISFQLKMFPILSDQIQTKLSSMKLVSTKTQACWYTLVDFEHYRSKLRKQKINNSIDLARQLLKQIGLLTIHGAAFGLDPRHLIVRYAFIDLDVSVVNKGADLRADVKAAQDVEYAYNDDRIHEGLCQLEKWLQQLTCNTCKK